MAVARQNMVPQNSKFHLSPSSLTRIVSRYALAIAVALVGGVEDPFHGIGSPSAVQAASPPPRGYTWPGSRSAPANSAARAVTAGRAAPVSRHSVFDDPHPHELPPARHPAGSDHRQPLPEILPHDWEDGYFEHEMEPSWHAAHGGLECPPVFSGLCWDAWEGFAGVQGFTGPVNRGSTGSFGFHQGMNWGTPLPLLFGDAVAGQLGVRAVQSNFRGAEFTQDERRQVFVTGGLFRRVDWGLQGGAVLDYLHESWYWQADFLQIRGELSWVYPEHHELGFWFSAGSQTQDVLGTVRSGTTQRQIAETYEGTDLYAFFYRYRADDCGGLTGRIFAGFTGSSAGLLGSDWTLPIHDSWAVQGNFIYLIPREGRTEGGHIEDAWNVGLSLVWRPGGGFQRRSYFQPLFGVADNGTLITRRQ